jgi:hypothetical protein
VRTTLFPKLFPLLLALLCAATPSFGVTGLFGPFDGIVDLAYSGSTVTYTNNIPGMRALGINPNIAGFSVPNRDGTFLTSDGTTCKSTDYLTLAKISHYLATSPDVVRPFILDLTGVMFGYSPERDCTCDGNGTCSNQWILRSNWVNRLTDFQRISGNDFNPSTVFAIVLHQEIANNNGAVVDNATIFTIADRIKQVFPGVPVLGGYPTQAALVNYGLQNTPLRFNSNLDYIGTWDYSVSDPRFGAYPTMYNDPNTGLKRRLRANQKLVYVYGNFNLDTSSPNHCPAQSTGVPYNAGRFDFNARAWCAWALKNNTDRSTTLLDYLWGFGGSQAIINWEIAHCGGTSLQPTLISVDNAAVLGSGCWQ